MLPPHEQRALDELVEMSLDREFPAAQAVVMHAGETVYERAFGHLDPDTRRLPTQLGTRFDLASLTMVYTSALFLTFVDDGRVKLDQPVCEILPEFSGVRKVAAHPSREAGVELARFAPPGIRQINARKVTFRHLLTHTSGLPAWLPLHIVESEMRQAGKTPLHINFALTDMVTETLFSSPVGSRVVFSDVGYILLGFAIERLGRKPLRQLMRDRLADPLGMLSLCYGALPCDDVAPTLFDTERGVRACGEAYDLNALALSGVAGHSGLFAHAGDVAMLGEIVRRGGSPLLRRGIAEQMTQLQAEDSGMRRGLGFALQSDHALASSSPFSALAFGHLGFTGTSLWVDPARELVVAILTNHAYYNADDDSMNNFRVTFHQALADLFPV